MVFDERWRRVSTLVLGRERARRSNIGGANNHRKTLLTPYIYADRKTEDGLKGRLNRLQASAKYAF